MAQRVLTDFVDAYLRYTENTEPMQTYHTFCAISAIAGALERKVYLRLGHQDIFPNFYIALVGPAGWARKGTALDLIRPIIEEAGIRTMSGAITMEKLSQKLKGAIENYTDPSDGEIKFQCAVTFISPELQVFLREKQVDLLARLTDLYDCGATWSYDTKNQGTDYVQGPFFNILSATAPDWIRSMIPDPAVGGGFTRRFIWVVEDDKRTIPEPSIDKNLEAQLINDLQAISLLAGQAKFTEEAHKIFLDWYIQQDKDYREGKLAIADPRFSGYCATRATLLLKMSLVCSVSSSSSLWITPEHFYRAKSILEFAEKKMPRAFQSMGQAKYADAVEQIFAFILKRKRASKAEILRLLYRDIDEAVYDIAVNTLLRMEVVDVEVNDGKQYIVVREGAERIFNL
jgi:hypothetical protein